MLVASGLLTRKSHLMSRIVSFYKFLGLRSESFFCDLKSRQEFVAEESFRIPFVVTFIISFAHLQVQSPIEFVPILYARFVMNAFFVNRKPIFIA